MTMADIPLLIEFARSEDDARTTHGFLDLGRWPPGVAAGFMNRPGPRIADSAELLGALLHPDRFPAPSGSAAVRWP